MKLATARPNTAYDPMNVWLENWIQPSARKTYRHVQSAPAVNMIEFDDKFRISLVAPGFQKEDFTLKVEDDQLVISLETKVEEPENARYLRKGFHYGPFQKRYTLGDSIDQENIVATYEQGILHVDLMKREEAKRPEPRQIEVA